MASLLHCNWWQQRNHQLALSTEQLQALWAGAWGQRRLDQAQALRAASGLFPSAKLSLSMGFGANAEASFQLANWPESEGHIFANPERLPFADSSIHCVELVFFLNSQPRPAAVIQEAARVLADGGYLLCINLLQPPRLLVPLLARGMTAAQRALWLHSSNSAPWQAYWQLRQAGLKIIKYQRRGASYMLVAEKRRYALRSNKATLAVPA